MSVLIAPSILSADFAALGADIAAVERGGADLIHVDVMDGHFVPNLTLGPAVVRAVKGVAKVPLDVHLMITDPDRYIDAFAEAGAAMMSVHVEVLPHLHRTVHAIKALGVKAGVVINPATPVAAIEQIAGDVDYVLVMSVNPGFGGQKFIPGSEAKVQAVRALLDRLKNPAPVEIDGGIDFDNVAGIVAAGARIVVAGSAIFPPSSPTGVPRNPERATRDLKLAALAGVSAPSPR
jgi:ribulose-phosphate 3-epimerase